MEPETAESQGGFAWGWQRERRRRGAEDEFFEAGNKAFSSTRKHIPVETENQETEKKSVEQFRCHVSQCHKVFDSLSSYELHYNSSHRNVCSHCHRGFPTNHLLEIHLFEWHDAMFDTLAKAQNMYQCLVISCSEKFPSSKARKNHLIKVHKYPSNFRFDRPKGKNDKKQSETKNESAKSAKSDSSMETEQVADNIQPEVTPSEERLAEPPDGEDRQMEHTPQSETSHVSESGRRFVYKVPRNICFGQGAQRGFQRSRGSGGKRNKKHWHQTGSVAMDTEVNIEEVNMADLATALDER